MLARVEIASKNRRFKWWISWTHIARAAFTQGDVVDCAADSKACTCAASSICLICGETRGDALRTVAESIVFKADLTEAAVRASTGAMYAALVAYWLTKEAFKLVSSIALAS